MTYKEKLKTSFGSLTKFEKIRYMLFTRWFVRDRKFFEGSFFLPGQMYKAERKGLYEAVRKYQPDYCFEIGTYTGGGSTYFLSEALKDNNKGKLITIEIDDFLFNKAVNRYKKYIKNNFRYIEFVKSSSPKVFEKYLQEKDKNFMVFLDGAEDGIQTLEQYNFFLNYFKKGTILALHDWNTEKTIKVKPVIAQNSHWTKILELSKPESIGFVVFKYE